MKIAIKKSKLMKSAKGVIEIEADIFAYRIVDGNTNYTFFVDISERLHSGAYEDKTTCGKYRVIPLLNDVKTVSRLGDDQGCDLSLTFDKASLVFSPLSDYNNALRDSLAYQKSCEVLCEENHIITGNEKLLEKIGIELLVQ